MQYRSRICPADSRKVLVIMPTEVIKNKHLKEILLFVSIKSKNWEQLKTQTPTLEQHNQNDLERFVKLLCYSKNTFHKKNYLTLDSHGH